MTTTRHAEEQAIAADLAQCDMIEAFGTAAGKRAARKQRKLCLAQIRLWNEEDGLADMTAEELMAELTA